MGIFSQKRPTKGIGIGIGILKSILVPNNPTLGKTLISPASAPPTVDRTPNVALTMLNSGPGSVIKYSISSTRPMADVWPQNRPKVPMPNPTATLYLVVLPSISGKPEESEPPPTLKKEPPKTKLIASSTLPQFATDAAV